MKKLVAIAAVAMMTLPTFAQKQPDYGADPENCKKNISLYRDYYKQKLYDDAYNFWRIAFDICPAASERMYVDGVKMLGKKIKKAEGEQKQALIDSLWLTYDRRIENFGKEGQVLGRKGTDMLRYEPKKMQAAYDVLAKSFELEGNKTQAGTLVSLGTALTKLEKKGEKTSDDVVNFYLKSSEVIAFNLEKHKGSKIAEYYQRAESTIGEMTGRYLSCEILIDMSNKNFEDNKENKDWLERTANLLERKGCTEDEIFFSVAKTLYDMEPTATSAEKMGVMSIKKKEYANAVNYYKQAIEMGQDEDKKADYYLQMSLAHLSAGQYASARDAARKATKFRSGFGMPYIIIGNAIAQSANQCKGSFEGKGVYWLAVDYYIKAKSVDASVAETANRQIATYKKYYPDKETIFFVGKKEGDAYEIGCWIGESTTVRVP